MASGLTRPALPLVTQGGSDKSSMCRGSSYQGGCVPLRIGSVNGFVEREGWKGSEYGCERASGLLLYPGDKVERRGY